jgi:hypothetical protein
VGVTPYQYVLHITCTVPPAAAAVGGDDLDYRVDAGLNDPSTFNGRFRA